jgi:hypothetical protein
MKIKLFEIEGLKRSSKYIYEHRLDHFFSLCVWAGWRQARESKVIPTFEAIWGTSRRIQTGLAIYQHHRTNEIRVATEKPCGDWRFWGHVETPDSREKTEKINAAINLAGLSIDMVLRDSLGRRELREILYFLPMSGKFSGPFWEQIEGADEILSSADSLRDLGYKNSGTDAEKANFIIEGAVNMMLENKSIQAGVKALAESSPQAPRNFILQPDLLQVS